MQKRKNKPREFNALDVFAISNEISEFKGARVQKVYQKLNNIYIKLYRNQEKNLVIGETQIYFTEFKPPFPQQPPNFCMFLRKHLTGMSLDSAEQYHFERLIEFTFTGKEKKLFIIAELFGTGNILVLNEDRTIIKALHSKEWSHRILKVKEQYKHPPEVTNTRELTQEEFLEKINSSKKDLVRFLAKDLSFGKLYAEELCARLKTDKNEPCEELTDAKKKKIHSEITTLFKEALKPKGFLFKNGEEFAPVKLVSFELVKTQEMFSQACDSIFSKQEEGEIEEDARELQKKHEKILKEQEATFAKILDNIQKFTKEADKLSAEQNFKESAVLYNKAKKDRNKIDGLRDALKKTKQKIEKASKGAERTIRQSRPKEKKAQKWYEKFRWFFSSDGFLVIGGKDATSNEVVIKKHTDPNDVVFHADITGAPFCVIKTEGKEVPETTLKETAQFAAVYSKAWQRGFGTVNIYYVKPEQVSKKAPSGEYVGKGAFMIYGRKTYFRNTEVSFFIGLTKEGEIVAGPEGSVNKRTNNYVRIFPGNDKSKELAKKIKKKLNADVQLDEIQRFIPSGKGRI